MIRCAQETQMHLIKLSGGERSRVGQLGQGRFSVEDDTIKELTVLQKVDDQI